MPTRHLAAALIVICAALPARAQDTPEDLVRWIYASLLSQPGAASGVAYLSAPERRRAFFTPRMVAFFDANDSYGDDLMMACLDHALEIPGQDFDPAEIGRTLTVTGSGDTGRRIVTARFTTFGQAAAVSYHFAPEDDVWRIDDIATASGRVMDTPCRPKAEQAGGAAGVVRGTGYCFVSGDDRLILDIAGDGRGLLTLESWQAGGHSCGITDAMLAPTQTGWRHDGAGATPDRPCTLTIDITPDGGIRLSDPGGNCKRGYCGQRAALDGLGFPAASQVACAAMPRN